MPRSRTRARERTFDQNRDPKWPKARRAQLRREVIRRLKKLKAYLEPPTGEHVHWSVTPAPYEKAPDLAVEGFNLSVIPAEEPGPPGTPAPAEVPDRRATRLSGMTVFTD